MNPGALVPDTASLYVQVLAAALFSVAFLFLWNHSRIVYFALWSAAWAVESLSILAFRQFVNTSLLGWFAAYIFGEYTFAVLLIAAARVGPDSPGHRWQRTFRIFVLFPLFAGFVFLIRAKSALENYHTFHAFLIGAVYFYSYTTIRGSSGTGGKFFRFSLLFLSLAFFEHAAVGVYSSMAGEQPEWLRFLQHRGIYDLVLHTLLVFAAMAMWIESQHDRIRTLGLELDRVRRESATNRDLDRLTGLQNQAALAKRLESQAEFEGVIAVCDMDNFKQVNDGYGHLLGDEILRGVGNLIRSSIRSEDEAFRWGGDEFVILFHNQDLAVARARMEGILARLHDFRVRGYGALPVSFSWGVEEAAAGTLREVLDRADRRMYELKRTRKPAAAEG